VPRSDALEADPAVFAARVSNPRRVQFVDLTNVFCSPTRCFPVIGGALVFKDLHHFTLVFAQTLAPALGRELDRVSARW
jgi:SGNH domain (fused to AT3 domains)